MKILMMTNSYTPMVGGIEQSIRSFTHEFERLGHEVVIAAPEIDGAPPHEAGVVRLRAIQNINNSEFSMALPMSSLLPELMKIFEPDIIHSHHPFWMGDIALRLSSQYRIPLVFTYHTMFEHHMHYLPIHSEATKRFITELFAGYANLATQVIAPSESVRAILLERGVTAPIEVSPTGVDVQRFARGDGGVIRQRLGIPGDSVVIGHVGRLALEKNIEFLTRGVVGYLKKDTRAHFLVGGDGPLKEVIEKVFTEQGIEKRLHWAGVLQGQDLVDCYQAMNIFAFASKSETQGIVLVEAMAAGVPVVAVDAPGVREVVKDGYNGRLIFAEDQDHYAEALAWCLKRPDDEFRQMRENARATAMEFAVEPCAKRMLAIYQAVGEKEYASPDVKNSAWGSLAGRLTTEWDMFKNMLYSSGAVIRDKPILNKLARRKPKRLLANLPRLLSLPEWSARLLRLPIIEDAEAEPGLVLIQIDGLSKDQLMAAIERGAAPFLRGLIQKEFYKVYSHYPGLPTSTPSVQGELFYGIKQCVPAFTFFDKEANRVFRMYDSDAAIEIEQRLTSQGEGLLKQGSSYSNIYSGGAEETHFCAGVLGWSRIWKDVNPVNLMVVFVAHMPSFIRMSALIIWELGLGIAEFFRGIFKGRKFMTEFKFIYLRALIGIHLRELVSLGARIDIARGLPIIHLNYLGYDENAHHSGPSSKDAHWALRGIDRAIEKIYRRAVHSPRRSYDVWIYSDHGQEDAVSYAAQYGRPVHEAVAEVFGDFDVTAELVYPFNKNGEQLYRARFLGLPFIDQLFGKANPDREVRREKKIVITAVGPTGNIYLPGEMSLVEKHQFAKALVDQAKIPVVMLPEAPGHVRVWTEAGEFNLPQDAGQVLGEDHPFLRPVTEDLIRLCHHPNAGDFAFMGFRRDGSPLTFPEERGSHAGPGLEETNAFALLPVDIIPRRREHAYLTPVDLRFAVMRFLRRRLPPAAQPYAEDLDSEKSGAASDTIRIMTYNVHSCVGTDGKISSQRIARVIGRHEPDIVALQELDMGRKRTGEVDQPHLIAKELEMVYHFHPSIVNDEGRYGNAVLSRFPMDLIRAGRLPGIPGRNGVEPRGVIWAVIKIGELRINIMNTHLGLLPWERNQQVQALLGPEWLAHPACRGPIILCGDFNASPGSRLCRNIKKVLRDAQGELDNHIPKATWFGHYPIGRIDHVFVGPELEVTQVQVSRTDLDKISSDHLPLIVDIKIKNGKRDLDLGAD